MMMHPHLFDYYACPWDLHSRFKLKCPQSHNAKAYLFFHAASNLHHMITARLRSQQQKHAQCIPSVWIFPLQSWPL